MSTRVSRIGLVHLLRRILPDSTPGLRRSCRSVQTLAFEELRISPDEPCQFTALILHGLLGSARNWRSFSRSLAMALSSARWRIVLVDLRNHGKSAEMEGFFPPHTLENAAKDLSELVKSQGWSWPDVVIGHSMGGKVALQYAQSCAKGDYGESVSLPKQLWVLDSVPGKVSEENSNGEVEKVLLTLQNLSSISSRKWLVDHMLELGFSNVLSQWIGSNLKTSGNQMTFSFNLEGAVQMFNSYREMDYYPLLENPPKSMEIAIVRAEKSDRWNPDVIKRLEYLSSRKVSGSTGQLSVHVLPHSGHWVHVENPKGLLDILVPKVAALV